MATDDVVEREQPCLCGKGTLHTTVTSPDHPWVRDHQITYTYELRCEDCAAKFVIDDDRLVDRDIWTQAQTAKQAASAAEREFVASAAVAELKEKFVSYLNDLGSVAAIYRCLNQSGLEAHSIATFRKRWRGPENWINGYFSTHHVEQIIALLNKREGPLAARLAGLKVMRAAIPSVPTVKRLR